MKEGELLEDLFRAYYDARKNKRNTINQLRFEMDLEHHLYDLCQQILKREYVPQPSIAFIVFKPVQREVFAADFKDRVVHHLFFNYVNPIFERTYIDDCYSCRVGKGNHYGVKRLDHHVRSCSDNYTRPCFIMKLDLQGYFMSIDRSILFEQVKNILLKYRDAKDANGIKWKDKLDYDRILYLARVIIFNDPVSNYYMKGTRADWEGLPPNKSLFHSSPGCGLPIGNLTSQLFSNIFLTPFDNYIKRELKFKHYGRYVDDFFIVHRDKEVLKDAIPKIALFLKDRLKITLHPKKIYIQQCQNGVLFTGAYVKPHRVYVSNRTGSNFQKSMTLLKLENQTDTDTRKIRNSINSYLGIMKHYKTYNIRQGIMIKHAWVFKYGYVKNCFTCYKLNKSILLENIYKPTL